MKKWVWRLDDDVEASGPDETKRVSDKDRSICSRRGRAMLHKNMEIGERGKYDARIRVVGWSRQYWGSRGRQRGIIGTLQVMFQTIQTKIQKNQRPSYFNLIWPKYHQRK